MMIEKSKVIQRNLMIILLRHDIAFEFHTLLQKVLYLKQAAETQYFKY